MTSKGDPRVYAKSLYAAAVAAGAVYASSIVDASRGGDSVTGGEWGSLVFAALIAGLGAYLIPNREVTVPRRRRRPAHAPRPDGQAAGPDEPNFRPGEQA